MKVITAVAALLMTGTMAQAGDSYAFEIGGRSVFIHAPSNCGAPSCLSVSIPGVFEYGPGRGRHIRNNAKLDSESLPPAETDVAPPRPESSAPASVSNALPQIATPVTKPEPTVPLAPLPVMPVAPTTVVAAAPVAAPVQQKEAPTPAPQQIASSPVGVWLTEEKEGKVRIEECGVNLCGYSVDAKTNENKDKVLINMRPTGAKWSGRIHDPEGGSTYDSTIALKGQDRLRVQGCAFGSMFCGGQTWSRIN